MANKTCDGCKYHRYRCGLALSIAKMMGITDNRPVWICKRLDREWPRDCAHPDRRAKRQRECIEQNLFEPQEVSNEQD